MNSIDDFKKKSNRVRLLAVIACYGNKNIEFLKKVVYGYQTMSINVDVVVISEAQKDIGAKVELVVGQPSKNPWSLPFAHKKIFAERTDQYDLFIYSEDDIGVTEENILAFMQVTASLNSDEIAGFIRYEIDKDGLWSVPDLHGNYHWKAESVRKRGEYTVAELTNEHAGFYILTQEQLRRSIASGGFLREPYEGRYDMACTAGTDPYTNCGFRKVICISTIEKFFVHHLSNRYAGLMGIPLSEFEPQIQTLLSGSKGKRLKSTFANTETRILHGRWSKSYYEQPNEDMLSLVPKEAKNILSVGCGWGASEIKLKQSGADINAIPLDSVIGATAERQGINVIYGDIEEAFSSISKNRFDVVVMTNLLHLLPNAEVILGKCVQLIRPGGSILLAGPNFDFFPHLMLRLVGWGDFRKLKRYEESGINVTGIPQLKKQLLEAGLRVVDVKWDNWLSPCHNKIKIFQNFGRYLSREWAIIAKR